MTQSPATVRASIATKCFEQTSPDATAKVQEGAIIAVTIGHVADLPVIYFRSRWADMLPTDGLDDDVDDALELDKVSAASECCAHVRFF